MLDESTHRRLEMSPLDRAQWKMDANVIRCAAFLAAPADVGRLRQDIDAAGRRQERLRARVMRLAGRPEIAIGAAPASLEVRDLPEARDRAAILACLAGETIDAADDGAPLWRWVLVQSPNCPEVPAALFMLCHHALADGRTALDVLHALGSARPRDKPQATATAPGGNPLAMAVGGAAWIATSLRSLAMLRPAGRIVSSPDVGLWTMGLSRGSLRQSARAWGSSQDAAIIALAGHFYHMAGVRPPLRLLVPISHQTSIARAPLGNFFMPAVVTLPDMAAGPAAAAPEIGNRLAAQARLMSPFGRAVFERYLRADEALGNLVPAGVYDRIREGYLGQLGGVCTLIPGPHRPIAVVGAEVTGIHGFAPVLTGTAGSVTAITYGGEVSLTLTVDPARVPDPAAIGAGMARLAVR